MSSRLDLNDHKKVVFTMSTGSCCCTTNERLSLYTNDSTGRLNFERRIDGFDNSPLFTITGVRGIEYRGNAIHVFHDGGEYSVAVIKADPLKFVTACQDLLTRHNNTYVQPQPVYVQGYVAGAPQQPLQGQVVGIVPGKY